MTSKKCDDVHSIGLKHVLIIDDHPVIWEGIKRLLNELTSGKYLIDEAINSKEALEAINEHDYDVIILDLKLGNESGMDLLKTIKQAKPDAKVLVMSVYAEEQIAIAAIKNGALGYVRKDQLAFELEMAIVKVSHGHRYVSQEVAEVLAEDLKSKTLSPQEAEVLKGIGCGKSTKEIAVELGISFKTVSTYRQRISEKLGLVGTNELIKYAVESEVKDVKNR